MISQIKMRRGTTAEWAAASPVVLAAGEPGWDSTLKGMKVGDGSTEWAALPWIDAKNADIRLGQNILHNWDFSYVVNQRGLSVYTAWDYHIDRWKGSGITTTLLPGYINIKRTNSGGYFCQILERELFGALVTVTVRLLGRVTHTLTGNAPLSSVSYDYTDNATIIIKLYKDKIEIMPYGPTGELNLASAKLELGAVSTLHLDPPADYGVELLKCQRYFRIRSTNNVSAVDLSPSMRITPTVTGSGPYYYSADL